MNESNKAMRAASSEEEVVSICMRRVYDYSWQNQNVFVSGNKNLFLLRWSTFSSQSTFAMPCLPLASPQPRPNSIHSIWGKGFFMMWVWWCCFCCCCCLLVVYFATTVVVLSINKKPPINKGKKKHNARTHSFSLDHAAATVTTKGNSPCSPPITLAEFALPSYFCLPTYFHSSFLLLSTFIAVPYALSICLFSLSL